MATKATTKKTATARTSNRDNVAIGIAGGIGLLVLGLFLGAQFGTNTPALVATHESTALPQPIPAPMVSAPQTTIQAPLVDGGCVTVNGNKICGAGSAELQQLAAGGTLRNFQEVQGDSHRESGACTPGETKWDAVRKVWRTCFAKKQ